MSTYSINYFIDRKIDRTGENKICIAVSESNQAGKYGDHDIFSGQSLTLHSVNEFEKCIFDRRRLHVSWIVQVVRAGLL